jgi:hypothetical protein
MDYPEGAITLSTEYEGNNVDEIKKKRDKTWDRVYTVNAVRKRCMKPVQRRSVSQACDKFVFSSQEITTICRHTYRSYLLGGVAAYPLIPSHIIGNAETSLLNAERITECIASMCKLCGVVLTQDCIDFMRVYFASRQCVDFKNICDVIWAAHCRLNRKTGKCVPLNRVVLNGLLHVNKTQQLFIDWLETVKADAIGRCFVLNILFDYLRSPLTALERAR